MHLSLFLSLSTYLSLSLCNYLSVCLSICLSFTLYLNLSCSFCNFYYWTNRYWLPYRALHFGTSHSLPQNFRLFHMLSLSMFSLLLSLPFILHSLFLCFLSLYPVFFNSISLSLRVSLSLSLSRAHCTTSLPLFLSLSLSLSLTLSLSL